jgi:hypothetical protein
VKKISKEKNYRETCSNQTCMFPNTCKWNKKCMQKELDLSIAAKKSFPHASRPEDLKGSKKAKF